MALTINETPFLFGWARNRARLKLLCSGIQQSSGTHAYFTIRFSTLGSTGTHVVLVIDGREIVFTIGTGADQYRADTLANLITKMAGNFYVNEIFTPTADTTNMTLALYGTKVGHHTVDVYTTDADGIRNGGESSLVSSISPSYEGLDKTRKSNYAVATQVEVTVNDYNVISTRQTETMAFQPDDDNYVSIPLDVVAGYIPQPDLPTGTGAAWQLLTNALLKYRVRYGEMWGSDVTQVQNMAWSDYFYALCGEMTERYAAVNLPDWKSGQQYQIGSDSNIFWVIGLDTGKVQHVRLSQPEWIYGLFYKSGVEIGTQVGSAYRVTVSIAGTRADGTTVQDIHQYTQVNGQVYRIDVSPSRLAVSDLLWYTVKVDTTWGSWIRTYRVMPDHYEQTYLLLQDKYGLLRVAVADRLDRVMTTEGEEMVVDRRRFLNLTRRSETYTATLEGLTREAAARIARSVGNEYHYVENQGNWNRVVIEPGSFTVRDEDDGLVSVALELSFVENQQENMSNAPLTRAQSFVYSDDEEVVSFGTVTDPDNNNLF